MLYTDSTPAITAPDEVLEGLEGARDQLRLLEQGMVVLAVEWAKHHPGEASAIPAASSHAEAAAAVRPAPPRFDEGQRSWDELAALGCLHFNDFKLPEFAIAAGLTEYSARKLLREALMLVHLLPRVWSRVLEGGLDVWRARALASDCWGLPSEAVEFIDAQMSDVTARVTKTSRERLVAEALHRFQGPQEAAAEEQAKASRCVDIDLRRQQHGVVSLFGELDLPDALALDAALTAGAQSLKDLGSQAPLNVRRAWALGDLARSSSGHGALFSLGDSGDAQACICACPDHRHPQAGGFSASSPVSLSGDGEIDIAKISPPRGSWVAAGPKGSMPEGAVRPYWNGKGASPPKVKLFIHLASPGPDLCERCSTGTAMPSGVRGDVPVDGTARVEGKGIAGSVICGQETVRRWFTRPTAAGEFMPPLTIRSVLDLDDDAATGSYAPTERIGDQVRLQTSSCVFPFCNRSAWRCDVDHAEPWKPGGKGGATCTCNLAPLCRRHHRLKTHSDNLAADQSAKLDGEHARWTYIHLGADEYFWKAPRGLRFIRTNKGTYEAAGDGRAGAPLHPDAPVTQDERVRLAENTIDRLLRNAANSRPIPHGDHSSTHAKQDEGESEESQSAGVELYLAPSAKVPLTSKAAGAQVAGPREPQEPSVEKPGSEDLESELVDHLAWLIRDAGPTASSRADFQRFIAESSEHLNGGEAA